MVAEADLDVVPLDVQLLVAPVRDLLPAGVLHMLTRRMADTNRVEMNQILIPVP